MNEVEMRVALRRARAHWVTADTLLWDVPAGGGLSAFFLHAPSDLDVSQPGTARLPLTPIGEPSDALRERFPHLASYSAYTLPPEAVAKARWLVGQALGVIAVAEAGDVVAAVSVQIPGVLDDLFVYDGPLGVGWADGVPTLRLWAPTARSVSLRLFEGPRTPAALPIPLRRDDTTGVWSVEGAPEWKGRYYVYEIEVYVASTGKVERNLVTDPYSLSLSANSRRSQIVDLEDPALAPPGWDALEKPRLEAPEDIVLYELHVRDFSIRDETIPEPERGTFKAFARPESRGMGHLRGLADAGLTHIHLMPVFDFASVNEERAEREEPDWAVLAELPPDSDRQSALVSPLRDRDGFNWGYDPFHFLAVEGSYATDPDGEPRILEMREAVQSLARAGLRVVMDVVFNHTFAHGQSPLSVLDRVVPGYYHRLEADGKVESSTCCSNTASEHRMMGRLMVDAVAHWARSYKIDGFRFDVMGHHMVSEMVAVRNALDALTQERDGVDGQRVYVYGEGWDFGEVANNARGRNASQLNVAGTGIGTFNDRLRDAVRGGGAFSGAREQGLATGLADDLNDSQQGSVGDLRAKLSWYTDLVRVGLAGNLRDFRFVNTAGQEISGAEVRYHDNPAGYCLDPQEQVAYVSAHDNETLFDAIQWKAPLSTPMEDRVRMSTLALSFVMLAQGVPFFHAGDDMLRSKSLDRNSYDSGDWWNALDFTYSGNNWGVGLPPGENERSWRGMRPLLGNPDLKAAREHVLAAVAAFRELLRIRRGSRLFRLRSAEEVQRRLSFPASAPEPGLVVLLLDNRGPDRIADAFDRIVVAFNTRKEEVGFTSEVLRGGAFALHEVQAASADALVRSARYDAGSGSLHVPRRTTAVFVERAPF
jgi:pullulanase